MTDEEKERVAIQVEHLDPDEAQAEYDKLTAVPLDRIDESC